MFNCTEEALIYIKGNNTLEKVKKTQTIREAELKFLKEKEQTIETLNRRMEVAVKIQFCNEAIASYYGKTYR